MINAIILAAGESRRMGKPKALCRWKDGTFLDAVVAYFRQAGIHRIGVVLGKYAEEIQEYGVPDGVDVWVNHDYKLGQFSSLQTAIRQQDPTMAGAAIALVDHPAVQATTVSLLLSAFDQHTDYIVKPIHQGRGGHPIIIGRDWWEEIVGVDLTAKDTDMPTVTLRDIISRRKEKVIHVNVDDPGILLDIDTPELLLRYNL